MVGLGRLELPTSRLSSARSNQLSYKPAAPDFSRKEKCPRTFRVSENVQAGSPGGDPAKTSWEGRDARTAHVPQSGPLTGILVFQVFRWPEPGGFGPKEHP